MNITNYSIAEAEEWRREKDRAFRNPHYSPLTSAQRSHFDGLRYFPIDPALSLIIKPEIFAVEDQTLQRIMTSTNEIRHYLRYGRLSFTIGDQAASLVLYLDQDGENFFLPFMDATTGVDTYAAGRYVEIAPLGGGLIQLDFNQAYNPYCAYNAGWSCPYVPADNRLSVPIRAGEMLPEAK